jgi:hypothetical protein
MDGSNTIFIVLPIVALVTLLVLVGLPYIGDRAGRGSQSGAGHSHGHQAHGEIPDHSAGPGAPGSDAIGPGHP